MSLGSELPGPRSPVEYSVVDDCLAMTQLVMVAALGPEESAAIVVPVGSLSGPEDPENDSDPTESVRSRWPSPGPLVLGQRGNLGGGESTPRVVAERAASAPRYSVRAPPAV